jgi:NitT/TauT family transport system permease protein
MSSRQQHNQGRKGTISSHKDFIFHTRIIAPLLVLVIFIVLWEAACHFLKIAPYILPAPHVVLHSIIQHLPDLLTAVAITLAEASLGFVLAVLIGFLSGCLFAHSRMAEYSLYPYMITLKAVPIIAIAPVLVTWFGDGMFGKIIMASIVAFFPVVVNTTIGLRAVDDQALLLLRSYSASTWQIFIKLRLPTSFPYLLSALKLSSTMSILGAIVAEFVGSTQGIGFSILLATYHLDTPLLFAAIVVIAMASVAVFMSLGATEKAILQRYRLFPTEFSSP